MNTPDNVSKELPSSPESLVQAIVADQLIISALSQAILSTMKQDSPSHATAQSRDKGATAPVGQPAEKPTTVSVDQMVRDNKRSLPIEVSDNDKNSHNQAEHSRLDDPSADESDLEGLLPCNSCWEPSEELDASFNIIVKPLQRFKRRSILKEFPRPASVEAFTPTLDNYLTSMISGVKIPDNSLRDIQDKLLDVLGPLCTLYKNCGMIYESMDQGLITLDKATVVGMFNCVKKSVVLVGDTSAQLSAKRCEQVLTKLNPVLSSLGKEEFPDAGKQVFLNCDQKRPTQYSQKSLQAVFSWFCPSEIPRAIPGRQRTISGIPRILPPSTRTPIFNPIIPGLRQSTQPYLMGSVSAKPTTSAVSPSCPTHLHSGMFTQLLNFPDLQLAGWLQHFLPAWEQITRDLWVFQVVLGYQIQFLDNPVQETASCAKPPFTSRPNYNRPGSSRATLKRGSSLCSIQLFPRTRVRKLLISSPKEGLGSQTGHKSKTSQQFHPIQTLQNGVYSLAEGSSKKRGLCGKNRPEGCIPDSAGLEEPPEIPSVFVEGFSARVCVSTLQSSQCSTGIHQTTETNTVNTKAGRNWPHCISRQYPPL